METEVIEKREEEVTLTIISIKNCGLYRMWERVQRGDVVDLNLFGGARLSSDRFSYTLIAFGLSVSSRLANELIIIRFSNAFKITKERFNYIENSLHLKCLIMYFFFFNWKLVMPPWWLSAKYSIYWSTAHSLGILTKRGILSFIFNPYAYLNSRFTVQSLKGKLYHRNLIIYFSEPFNLIHCSRKY